MRSPRAQTFASDSVFTADDLLQTLLGIREHLLLALCIGDKRVIVLRLGGCVELQALQVVALGEERQEAPHGDTGQDTGGACAVVGGLTLAVEKHWMTLSQTVQKVKILVAGGQVSKNMIIASQSGWVKGL